MVNRVMTLPMLDDEEYKAMMDIIKASYLEIDPATWKDISCDIYDNCRDEGKDVPLGLLQTLSGDPWVCMMIPPTEDTLDGRPGGPDVQNSIPSILASHFATFYYLYDTNTGNVFITIPFDRKDCMSHGVEFNANGVGNSETGSLSKDGAIPFPVCTFPLSEREKTRYFNELIAREIDAYGPDAVNMTEREAKRWKKDKGVNEKAKAYRDKKSSIDR